LRGPVETKPRDSGRIAPGYLPKAWAVLGMLWACEQQSRRLGPDAAAAGRGHGGGTSGLKVTRIDPGVVSRVAELRDHARRPRIGQWKTGGEECRVIYASPTAIKPAARHGESAQVFPANGVSAAGDHLWMA
jgi:hypothetical protein